MARILAEKIHLTQIGGQPDPPSLQALVENTSSVENEQVHSEQVSESLDMASWK